MRHSLITLIAALMLLATTAFAGGLGQMTDAERAAFRDEVKQYLLENPDVITEAMQVLQDRQDQAAAKQDQTILSQNAEAIFKDPASWAGGNPDGNITIVEFMDYRCPYCRKAFSEVEDLVKTDGNIRFVVLSWAQQDFVIAGGMDTWVVRPVLAVAQACEQFENKLYRTVLMAARPALALARVSRQLESRLYNAVLALGRLNCGIGRRVRMSDERGIDGLIFALVRGSLALGEKVRALQSGLIHRELAMSVLGTAVILAALMTGLLSLK